MTFLDLVRRFIPGRRRRRPPVIIRNRYQRPGWHDRPWRDRP